MEYQPGLLKFHSSDCRTEDAEHEQTADEKMHMTRLNEPFRTGAIAADGSSSHCPIPRLSAFASGSDKT